MAYYNTKNCLRCEGAGVEHPTEIASLLRQLKTQRLIKIVIGDASEPYLISGTALIAASDYFDKALKHESSLGASDLGVLRFPEDDDFQEAWGILLFWVMMKRLPPECTGREGDEPDVDCAESWIRTWVLVDKYILPELQDAVMLEVLRQHEQSFLAIKFEEAEMINLMLRISPVDSPLHGGTCAADSENRKSNAKHGKSVSWEIRQDFTGWSSIGQDFTWLIEDHKMKLGVEDVMVGGTLLIFQAILSHWRCGFKVLLRGPKTFPTTHVSVKKYMSLLLLHSLRNTVCASDAPLYRQSRRAPKWHLSYLTTFYTSSTVDFTCSQTQHHGIQFARSGPLHTATRGTPLHKDLRRRPRHPHHIPESVLISSSDYFAKAIEHENSLGNSGSGVLKFPEDGEFEEAWKILLYWIVNKCLPTESEVGTEQPAEEGKVLTLVRAWALGDKYLFPALQDATMLELLAESDHRPLTQNHDELYAMLRVSPTGSSLRRLLAEDAIRLYDEESTDEKPSIAQYLEARDGIFGLAGSLVHAQQSFISFDREYPRCSFDLKTKMSGWKEYIQGDWPLHRWLMHHLMVARISPISDELSGQ